MFNTASWATTKFAEKLWLPKNTSIAIANKKHIIATNLSTNNSYKDDTALNHLQQLTSSQIPIFYPYKMVVFAKPAIYVC